MGRFNHALKAALAAGALGALAAGVFHLVASEPLIDQAIAIEAAGRQSEAQEVVSREGQKLGLLVALLLYGLIWAALLAATTHLMGFVRVRQVVGAAIAAAWATAVFPFLKYPANPPGVGDPETLLSRQVAYLLCLAVGVIGAFGAYQLAKRAGVIPGTAAYAGLMLAAFAVLPPNPDPVALAPDLLLAFRLRALGGLLVFWATFTLAFAWLFGRSSSRAGTPGAFEERGRRGDQATEAA